VSKRIKVLEEMAEIILLAITQEQASVSYYTDTYQKAKTETAKKTFLSLLEEEKGHEAKLRRQLHEIQSEIELERQKLK
jgi:rubrerythrin